MKPIQVILDFDGTLTGLSGNKLFKRNDFKELFAIEPDTHDFLTNSQYIGSTDAYLKAKEEAKKQHQEIGISPENIKALRELLQLEHVDLTILSNNRAEYISTVLRAHGLSEEELKKIHILDRKYADDKMLAVKKVAANEPRTACEACFIFDDDEGDRNNIKTTMKSFFPSASVHAISFNSGTLNLSGFFERINQEQMRIQAKYDFEQFNHYITNALPKDKKISNHPPTQIADIKTKAEALGFLNLKLQSIANQFNNPKKFPTKMMIIHELLPILEKLYALSQIKHTKQFSRNFDPLRQLSLFRSHKDPSKSRTEQAAENIMNILNKVQSGQASNYQDAIQKIYELNHSKQSVELNIQQRK